MLTAKLFDKDLVKNILVIASPISLQALFSIGSWLLFFFFIEHLGKQESAITQICRSVFGVAGSYSWAIAGTTESMVSNLIGQKQFDLVKPLIFKLLGVAIIGALIMCSPYVLFPQEVLAFYTKEAELIQLTLAPLKVVVGACIFISVSNTLFNALLGLGHTRVNLAFEFIAILAYILYIYYFIEIKRVNLVKSWLCEYLYWGIIMLLTLTYFKLFNWRKAADKAVH